MPVDKKHLESPTPLPIHSRAEKSQAFKAGEEAYRLGRTLESCPAKYKPVMGDSALYDSFRHGFLTASVAKVPQRTSQRMTA